MPRASGCDPTRPPARLYLDEHGAGLRALYDLADPRRSRIMLSSGQSGLAFSGQYRNFLQPWSRVEFVPLWGDGREGESLTLVPR